MKKYIERYWRKATKEDSVREPMMDARFSNDPKFGFVIGKLANWHRDNQWPWVDENGRHWNTAEVYDAPDPGEGYELIDPTIEKPGPGIEYRFGIYWHGVSATAPLDANMIYRRKIVQEAAEPVTFVVHPIQFNDKGECLFYGKVIQERSYAVLNEQGHYLMWRLGVGPVYVPEFRQAFTPTQLQQVSVRELGSNIRLRAVEPVDVDKLKQEYMQELKEKLQPKAPQPAKSLRQAYEDASRLKVILSLLDSFQPITHAGAEKKSWIRSAAMFLIGETERCIHDNSLDLGKRVED